MEESLSVKIIGEGPDSGTGSGSGSEGGAESTALARDNGTPVGDADILSMTGCQRPMESSGILCGYTGFGNIAPLVNPATGSRIVIFRSFLFQQGG